MEVGDQGGGFESADWAVKLRVSRGFWRHETYHDGFYTIARCGY